MHDDKHYKHTHIDYDVQAMMRQFMAEYVALLEVAKAANRYMNGHRHGDYAKDHCNRASLLVALDRWNASRAPVEAPDDDE